MKKLLFIISTFLFFSTTSFGQIFDPVSWESQLVKGDDQYYLIFEGTIDDTWSIYSQTLSGDEGPIPTEVVATEGPFEIAEMGTECGDVKVSYDPVFEMEIKKFTDKAIIIKPIKVTAESGKLEGYLTYMSCDATQCLPPMDYDFSHDISDALVVEDFSTEQACDSKYIGSTTPKKKDKKDSGLLDPKKWDYELVQIDDNTYDLEFNVVFDEGWHAYSVETNPDDGPVPTLFKLDEGDHFELVGDIQETSDQLETKDDPFFGMELTTLGGTSKFTQRIKVTDPNADILGFYEYQVCDATQCLPPYFEEIRINIAENYFGLLNPVEEVSSEAKNKTKGENTPVYQEFNKENMLYSCDETTRARNVEEGSSFFWIFAAGFAGGLIALLTPCVFPMIPLTVSYFTKSKKSGLSNAIIYGISIIVIYLILGLLVTGIAGPEALNQLSTNAWFNIFFFLLFVVFAFSFFGYFELTLPSSWVNSSDKAADQGGLIGTFFMAFTLALVSFSCTGPIIGTLLVETATGGGPMLFGYLPAGPLVGMFGFSFALALPFALFAAFPSWLNSLPRSGSWMTSVKVTLGFVEIALAFKFLSIADLTMGWKILPYELFIAVWVLCAVGLALYYFGYLRFPHDSPIKKLSVGRIVLGIIATIIAIYVLSGFIYDKRGQTFKTPTALSGLAPPAGHSYIFPNSCPLNLNCFKDFNEGVAYAKSVDKPILLDFTGHGCVNCRKMEDQVWSDDEVFRLLDEEYVIISLYVDEREPLEESYTSAFDGKEKTNVGKKWSDFQAIHFNRNSQPYYVLMDHDLKILNQPRAYTPEVDIYRAWLECGLEVNGK